MMIGGFVIRIGIGVCSTRGCRFRFLVRYCILMVALHISTCCALVIINTVLRSLPSCPCFRLFVPHRILAAVSLAQGGWFLSMRYIVFAIISPRRNNIFWSRQCRKLRVEFLLAAVRYQSLVAIAQIMKMARRMHTLYHRDRRTLRQRAVAVVVVIIGVRGRQHSDEDECAEQEHAQCRVHHDRVDLLTARRLAAAACLAEMMILMMMMDGR
mmetsp:Transcript_10767/g.26596  ORF Transcript_10767/g.26596 Transcript_10767/m.26596 type:complete len:212 (-) Transcript_10767:351-986(-)